MQITPSDRVTSRVKQKISIKHFIKDIENKASEALIEENESIKSVHLHLGFNKIKTVI